jgi:hypothetical protein
MREGAILLLGTLIPLRPAPGLMIIPHGCLVYCPSSNVANTLCNDNSTDLAELTYLANGSATLFQLSRLPRSAAGTLSKLQVSPSYCGGVGAAADGCWWTAAWEPPQLVVGGGGMGAHDDLHSRHCEARSAVAIPKVREGIDDESSIDLGDRVAPFRGS